MVAVKGSCPVMTFSVAGTMIWMDSTTVLNGLSCAQLVNGTIVRVSGFRRQDGSILASALSAPHAVTASQSSGLAGSFRSET